MKRKHLFLLDPLEAGRARQLFRDAPVTRRPIRFARLALLAMALAAAAAWASFAHADAATPSYKGSTMIAGQIYGLILSYPENNEPKLRFTGDDGACNLVANDATVPPRSKAGEYFSLTSNGGKPCNLLITKKVQLKIDAPGADGTRALWLKWHESQQASAVMTAD